MSGAIGKGDWVECVDDAPRGPNHLSLGVGTVHRVVAVRGHLTHGNPCVFVLAPGTLVAVNGMRPYGGHAIDRFRPVYRPKQSIIDALMAPPKRAPREREDA